MQQRDIPEPIRRRIRHLLPQADLVKFAKHRPSIEEANAIMEQARNIVEESLEYHRQSMQAAAETSVSHQGESYTAMVADRAHHPERNS
jgi:hypothetical protein